MRIAKNDKTQPYSLIFLFLLIYLIFPNQNSGVDAYCYAANIRWDGDLFFPHHLLYNFFACLVYQMLKIAGQNPDALALMKSLNAIFASFCLLVFYHILNRIEKEQNDKTAHIKHLFMLLFAGSSFGLMRFATENETYIIPIFWSLLASYYYLGYLQKNSKIQLVYCGLMASLACLFHQIHIFWYAGLFISVLLFKKNTRDALLLILPSILIPIVYYIAFIQKQAEFAQAGNLLEFMLYDYYYGPAGTSFGTTNLILGFISFIRSFVQVHGIIPLLFKQSLCYYFAAIIAFVSFVFFIIHIFRNKPKRQLPGYFIKTHLVIFILQWAFAIFSVGNAEFMVMLPILFILIINGFFYISRFSVFYLALFLLIWNMSFGIVPNRLYDYDKHSKTIDFIESNSKAVYILSDDVQIQNMMYYKTSKEQHSNIYKSPASMKSLGFDIQELKTTIDSSLKANIPVYTDCINEPKVLNRKNFIQKNENEAFSKNFSCQKVDSISSILGKRYLYRIENDCGND